MKRLRIPPLAIAIIGVVLCLAAVGLIFTFMIKPTQDKIVAQQAILNTNAPDATASAQQAAQKDVVAAQQEVNEVEYQWSLMEGRLMPHYNIDLPRLTAWRQLSNELTYNLGPDIEHWIPRTGVIPLTTVSISPPPTSPNDIPSGPIIIPIGGSGAASSGGSSGSSGGYSGGTASSGGSITVTGDFRRILYHFLKWNDFNRLVLADNLQLHGNSPFMTASYSAEVIIFPQGDPAKMPKTIDAAGSGAAATGTGGGPGRPVRK